VSTDGPVDHGAGLRAAALGQRTTWLLLAAVVVLVWVAVGIPTWHIQPFRPQSGDGMAWSYALRSRGPLLTAIGVVAAAALVVVGWQTASRWRRVGLAALLVLTLAPAWFVRQNHFEWMFAPLAEARYTPVAEAGFLADAEMVMGVEVGGDRVAFPIRQLAYHHVVNTEVADEPVVATY
jgi:Protein of unknown function (DUF3179)